MKRLLLASTAILAFAVSHANAQVVDDPLHGFCGAGCADNGTNTPITSNPPVNFGFTVSPGPQTGSLILDVLVPDIGPINPAITVGVTGGATTNLTLFSTSPWTSGDLSTFLGISASPSNPIGAYLPASEALLGQTFPGFWVLQANLGTQTLSGPGGPFLPTFNLAAGAQGMYMVGFLNTVDNGIIATANSGALFETSPGNTINPVAAVPEPATWGMMLLGFVGLTFAFKNKRRKVSFA